MTECPFCHQELQPGDELYYTKKSHKVCADEWQARGSGNGQCVMCGETGTPKYSDTSMCIDCHEEKESSGWRHKNYPPS